MGILAHSEPPSGPLRVLMLTSEWPSPERPGGGAFIVRQARALRDAGVEVDVLDFVSRFNLANHFRAWRRMRKMMAAKPYDLIHAQFAITVPIGRMQASLPVVATYHGDELYGVIRPDGSYALKGIVLTAFSQLAAFGVDALIVVSRAMGRRLWRRDYHIVPSGIELDKFRPMPRDAARARLGWPADQTIALFATLNVDEPRKRYRLAQAAVALAARVVPLELRVVTGVEPDQVPLYMNAADVLLLTSLHEGSPTVIKEALACNLPIVTVPVGDVEERLAGISQCQIAAATPEALAEALIEVAGTPTRSNGRKSVLALAETELAQQVIAIYREVVRSHARRGRVNG